MMARSCCSGRLVLAGWGKALSTGPNGTASRMASSRSSHSVSFIHSSKEKNDVCRSDFTSEFLPSQVRGGNQDFVMFGRNSFLRPNSGESFSLTPPRPCKSRSSSYEKPSRVSTPRLTNRVLIKKCLKMCRSRKNSVPHYGSAYESAEQLEPDDLVQATRLSQPHPNVSLASLDGIEHGRPGVVNIP